MIGHPESNAWKTYFVSKEILLFFQSTSLSQLTCHSFLSFSFLQQQPLSTAFPDQHLTVCRTTTTAPPLPVSPSVVFPSIRTASRTFGPSSPRWRSIPRAPRRRQRRPWWRLVDWPPLPLWRPASSPTCPIRISSKLRALRSPIYTSLLALLNVHINKYAQTRIAWEGLRIRILKSRVRVTMIIIHNRAPRTALQLLDLHTTKFKRFTDHLGINNSHKHS